MQMLTDPSSTLFLTGKYRPQQSVAGKKRHRWGLGFTCLGSEEDHEEEEECRKRKDKLPWVRSQENLTLTFWAGQMGLRAVQMEQGNKSFLPQPTAQDAPTGAVKMATP